jgi:hypothetical protein
MALYKKAPWFKRRDERELNYLEWKYDLYRRHKFDDEKVMATFKRLIEEKQLNPSERAGAGATRGQETRCPDDRMFFDVETKQCVEPTFQHFLSVWYDTPKGQYYKKNQDSYKGKMYYSECEKKWDEMRTNTKKMKAFFSKYRAIPKDYRTSRTTRSYADIATGGDVFGEMGADFDDYTQDYTFAYATGRTRPEAGAAPPGTSFKTPRPWNPTTPVTAAGGIPRGGGVSAGTGP